jgi:hypothetical protein
VELPAFMPEQGYSTVWRPSARNRQNGTFAGRALTSQLMVGDVITEPKGD